VVSGIAAKRRKNPKKGGIAAKERRDRKKGGWICTARRDGGKEQSLVMWLKYQPKAFFFAILAIFCGYSLFAFFAPFRGYPFCGRGMPGDDDSVPQANNSANNFHFWF
jgi:hypothetical protein